MAENLFYLTSYVADEGTPDEEMQAVLHYTRHFTEKMIRDCTKEQIQDAKEDAEQSLPFMREMFKVTPDGHIEQRIRMLELFLQLLPDSFH